MVTVGDIEGIDLGGEKLRDAGDGGVVVDHPEGVDELVLVGKLVFGLAGGRFRDDFGEFRVVLESEEDRLDVRVLDADMDHAVVFLVLAGEFVFLDDTFGIVVGMGAEDDAVLGALAHGLGIHVVHGLRILDQPALFAPGLEVLHGLVVGALFVLACDGGEVDFGLGDMQEGLLAGHGEGLFGIQDVIRGGGHFGDQVLRRTDGRKGFYSYHGCSNVMWLIVPKDSQFPEFSEMNRKKSGFVQAWSRLQGRFRTLSVLVFA